MDRSLLHLTIVLIFSLLSMRAKEYIYPVASMQYKGAPLVCMLYQKEGGLELLSWNPVTKEVGKILSSRFIPTNIQALPDQSGFSFIDQGVIWVKSFFKRSPRPLDIPSPLCNVDLIFWKDGQSCYFSARQDGQYALFELDLQGNLDCLVSSKEVDCIYPQKVGTSLFFLSRNRAGNTYQLRQTTYPSIYHEPFTFNSGFNFDQRVDKLFHNFQHFPQPLRSLAECPALYTFQENIAFLNMISDSEGFVLGYPPTVSLSSDRYHYYHLKKQAGVWGCTLLFSFSLPLYLIKPSRTKRDPCTWLYESILPLLPLYVSETGQLYYSHFSEGCLDLYCYNLTNGNIAQVTDSSNRFCFSPLCIEGRLYCGGVIDTVINRHSSDSLPPSMWLNDQGRVSLNLYQLDLN